MNTTPIARLLIVDDESVQLKALSDTLSIEGYSTTGFTSARRALDALGEQEFDLLLTDLMMPEMDGIALLTAARALAPDQVAIVMTGHAAIDTAVRAMQAGALDYIVKPFRLNMILPVINRALAVRELRRKNRQLEARIRERTHELELANRQLETVNRELESFSYSVSHDLRAPARTVLGFCEAYMEDFKDSIPAAGWPMLKHVEAGARRMGQLIEDLLALSQLGRQPLLRGRIDLDPLAHRLIEDLFAKEPLRRQHTEVRIGTLGHCNGDASLIEQVWVNLLSNAFKFTRERRPAIIELGCQTDGSATAYFVRDNGAGFNMGYAHRLFGVFQRLHSESDFEGTGVGLSIVHRIIQRHGGRIWAESAVDKGATFHFTLAPDQSTPVQDPGTPAQSSTPGSSTLTN
jgi:two-component system, sensor histidine kinase and response regulator